MILSTLSFAFFLRDFPLLEDEDFDGDAVVQLWCSLVDICDDAGVDWRGEEEIWVS